VAGAQRELIWPGDRPTAADTKRGGRSLVMDQAWTLGAQSHLHREFETRHGRYRIRLVDCYEAVESFSASMDAPHTKMSGPFQCLASDGLLLQGTLCKGPAGTSRWEGSALSHAPQPQSLGSRTAETHLHRRRDNNCKQTLLRPSSPWVHLTL